MFPWIWCFGHDVLGRERMEILVIVVTLALCFGIDKLYTKLFRSAPEHKTGKSVRLPNIYGVFGIDCDRYHGAHQRCDEYSVSFCRRYHRDSDGYRPCDLLPEFWYFLR